VDLSLYSRVLWRFRALVALGLLLAMGLAFLSYARVTLAHGRPVVSYRQGEVWASTTRLLVTQPGFQEGRVAAGGPDSNGTAYVPAATPQWLATLAQVYQQLANSDAVQLAFKRDQTVHGSMNAVAEYDANQRQAVPVLDINGLGPTPLDATYAGRRGAEIFMNYFKRQQAASGVSAPNRVQLTVLNDARGAQLVTKRKKTLPIVVFVTVLAAALGLCFILENLRPRIRAVAPEAGEDEPRLRGQLGA
jgi:hypothetical protein